MTAGHEPEVTLRPEVPEDLPWLWRWRHGTPDPEWQRWDAPYFHVLDEPVTWAEFAATPRGPHPDARVVEVAGEPVGMVTRHEKHPAGGGWWSWGIVLYDPAHWGSGIGTRAGRLWVDDTFEQRRCHVLTLATWSGNERMQALGRRLGFTECARFPQARLWEGRRYDSVEMALLRTRWAEQGRS